MKNNTLFLIAITALSLIIACEDKQSETHTPENKTTDAMLDYTLDLNTDLPVQHMDFDTIDIEPSSDFEGLDLDMEM